MNIGTFKRRAGLDYNRDEGYIVSHITLKKVIRYIT